MARAIHRLTSDAVESTTEPGRYPDGAGLYLQVGPTGSKSWLLRFMRDGRAREMGLGALHTVGLLEARKRAKKARLKLLDGVDPIENASRCRRRVACKARLDYLRSMCRRLYQGASVEVGVTKARRAMAEHARHLCGPIFGSLPVQAVDTALVIKVLEPICRPRRLKQRGRVRGRIEGPGLGESARLSRWREPGAGAPFDKLLPKRRDVQNVEHFAALPYAEVASFMHSLRDQEGNAARASGAGHPDRCAYR
jgi:hypothetical protein